MMVVVVVSACTTLREGSGSGASAETGSDDTASSTSTASTSIPSSTIGEGPGTTEAATSSTTDEPGDTTQPGVTTDTNTTSGATEAVTTQASETSSTTDSPSSSSSTGSSECDYFAGACGNCIDNMCCTALMECEAGPMQCQDLVDCLMGGTSSSQCASEHDHPSTNDLVDCIETQCTPPCS